MTIPLTARRIQLFVHLVAVGLVVFIASLRGARVQQPSPKALAGCVEMSKTYPLSLPNESGGPSTPGARQLRDHLRLSRSVTVTVSELRDPTEAGDYDSTVTINSPTGTLESSVPKLVKGGEALRLFRVATVCQGFGQALMLLGFTAGWTDAIQGFIVVRESGEKPEVYGLPLASHGRLVYDRRAPETLQLWSARGQGLCEACPKRYVVQDCQIAEKGVQCKPRAKLTPPMSPNVITADIVKVK